MNLLRILFPLVLIAGMGGMPMSETSLPWDGDTGGTPAAAGDAGPYTAGAWDDMYASAFGDGVLPGVGGELAVSGTSSPVAVAAGAAFVNGKFYKNSASLNVVVPTPTSATRIDRIVLRADYTAQTVRIVRKAGAEGTGNPPALTQSDGVTWEISLAQVSITTAGVVTVTSERTAADQGRLPGEITIMYANSVSAAKNPVRNGLTFSKWFLCDGGTYNGRAAPDMRDKFALGVGTIVGSQGTTGGAATKDLSHTHAVGTLDNAAATNHTHGVSLNTGSPTYDGPYEAASGSNSAWYHTHAVSGNTAAGGAHDHAISGATASGGSATQDIMPPYIGVRWFMYSP